MPDPFFAGDRSRTTDVLRQQLFDCELNVHVRPVSDYHQRLHEQRKGVPSIANPANRGVLKMALPDETRY